MLLLSLSTSNLRLDFDPKHDIVHLNDNYVFKLIAIFNHHWLHTYVTCKSCYVSVWVREVHKFSDFEQWILYCVVHTKNGLTDNRLLSL